MKALFVFLFIVPGFLFAQNENDCIGYKSHFDTISSKSYFHHKSIISLYSGKTIKNNIYGKNHEVINNFIVSQDFIALVIHLDTNENQFYQEYSTSIIKLILFKENFKAISSAFYYIYDQKPYYEYFLDLIEKSHFTVDCKAQLIKKINLIEDYKVDKISNFKQDLISRIH